MLTTDAWELLTSKQSVYISCYLLTANRPSVHSTIITIISDHQHSCKYSPARHHKHPTNVANSVCTGVTYRLRQHWGAERSFSLWHSHTWAPDSSYVTEVPVTEPNTSSPTSWSLRLERPSFASHFTSHLLLYTMCEIAVFSGAVSHPSVVEGWGVSAWTTLFFALVHVLVLKLSFVCRLHQFETFVHRITASPLREQPPHLRGNWQLLEAFWARDYFKASIKWVKTNSSEQFFLKSMCACFKEIIRITAKSCRTAGSANT